MMPPSRSGHFSAIALPTSLLLLGAALRLGGLGRDQRLHPDEALYADLGRRVGVWGDWPLTDFPVDKPPLFFFSSGLSQAVIGQSEFAVRLPNAFASLLALAVCFALVRHLTGDPRRAALIGLLVALSPFDIAFAMSGFVEPLLMLFALLGLWAMLLVRPGWSGLAFGLAMAVKPAALFWLPLLAWAAWIHPAWRWRMVWRWAWPVLLVLALITLWDRAGSLGSFWTLGEGNLAADRFIRADEVGPRAVQWADWLAYIVPWPVLVGGLGILAWRERHLRTRQSLFAWGLGGFALTYVLLHWFVAFNTFDRYLMPLLPVLILLAGWGWSTLRRPLWVGAALLVIGLPGAWQAARGDVPLAGNMGGQSGIDALAKVMNTHYAGDVFYEHGLGWSLGYYLGAEPRVFVLYFETPAEMVAYAREDLIASPRYLVGPRAQVAFWVNAARAAGLTAQRDYTDKHFAIYRLSLP